MCVLVFCNGRENWLRHPAHAGSMPQGISPKDNMAATLITPARYQRHFPLMQ
jgi:hypothetical protein